MIINMLLYDSRQPIIQKYNRDCESIHEIINQSYDV